MKKFNLLKTAKEQKVWFKKMGVHRVEVMQMACYRDELAAKAMKAIGQRKYDRAIFMLNLADKYQHSIDAAQQSLDVIDKVCR